ncbi:MAG TPA: hypothetical protein VK543_07840, partial [Puia sp.]|nr:hypothetical protein [Puia sp.]
IYSGKKNILCPFVVEPVDETYFFDKMLGGANEKSGYVYRLVDKEHLPAMFSLSFNDKATALTKRVPLSKLTRKLINRMPQVDFAADHFSETSPGLFSFVIPLYNLEDVPGELTLFISRKKYSSKEEAVKGFDDNLIDVLSYAADQSKYGDYIISGTEPETVNTIVEIPDDAKTALENALGAGWVAELAKRMTIYPFRKIDIKSVQYAEIYCRDYQKPDPGMENDPANSKYYFNLPLDTDIVGNWISATHFENLQDAMKEFAFFNMLVNYPGNYYAECACTGHFDQVQIVHSFSFKIFMREVLAQSTDIFATIEDAWGPKGIERFICAAEGEKAFWTYQRNKECYSFYVTCGSGSLKHPCTYDTEEIRKDSMNKLYEAAKNVAAKSSWFFNSGNGELSDGEGKPFARIAIDKVPRQDRCDLFVTIAGLLSNKTGNTVYNPDSGFLQLTLSPNIIIVSTEKKPGLSNDHAGQWIKEWENLLYTWAFYFPIVKTKLKTNKGEPELFKYCVEIKFPGFDERSVREGKNLCQIAWASTCCYSSCDQALAAWQEAWKTLADKNNYRPVYDCQEKTFGIALHPFHPSQTGNNQNPAASDIIAINPQCYPNWKEDCQAVERAIRWINIQGLHLIEHILLRPFKPEDCRCRLKQAACGTDCVFPNWVQEDTECAGKEVQVCFKPGTDPYSFIATIFLPAWSKRFRDEKERLLFERLLYREAPAHVLLRIIWLRPFDFCRLESVMFDWQKWIAGFPLCNMDFSLCNLIDLLFNRYYDCLPDCTDCLPCKDTQPVKPGCWDPKDSILRPLAFIDQINALYCFEDYCGRKEKPQEPPKEPPKEEPKDDPKEKPKGDPKEKPKEEPKPRRRKKPESPIDRVSHLAGDKAKKKKKKDK